jgi:hypothetical protein
MSEPNKAWTENWAAAQQALLKTFVPWAPGTGDATQPHLNASPLEAQFDELRDTWQASLTKWTDFAKDASKGELPAPEKLREMFTPASWTGPGAGVMDAALQRVLEGPRYATLWDLDRKLLELQKLTLDRDKHVASYQAVVQKAWNLAFERFTKAVAAETAGKHTWRGLTDKWLAVANDTLIEVYRSHEFVQAQRRMLRAASDRHLQEREIAEAWCQAVHVPTRSEVDELQRSVIELRREVRALRRGADGAGTREAAPAASTRKASTRRARPAAKRVRT